MTLRCLPLASPALLAVIPSAAWAEPGVKIWHPTAGTDRVAITAESLAVNDADKIATFTDHVVIEQGATHLMCSRHRLVSRGDSEEQLDRPHRLRAVTTCVAGAAGLN